MTDTELSEMKHDRDTAFQLYRDASQAADEALRKWSKLSTDVAREEMRRELRGEMKSDA